MSKLLVVLVETLSALRRALRHVLRHVLPRGIVLLASLSSLGGVVSRRALIQLRSIRSVRIVVYKRLAVSVGVFMQQSNQTYRGQRSSWEVPPGSSSFVALMPSTG